MARAVIPNTLMRIENIYVFNATMTTSGDGARIKVYGSIPPTSTSVNSGGTGYVRNVTYNGIHDISDDCKIQILELFSINLIALEIDAIELTQCYAQSNITACNLYPVSPHLHPTTKSTT
jgi:galacturan 1,4-alpha-galacturonidase